MLRRVNDAGLGVTITSDRYWSDGTRQAADLDSTSSRTPPGSLDTERRKGQMERHVNLVFFGKPGKIAKKPLCDCNGNVRKLSRSKRDAAKRPKTISALRKIPSSSDHGVNGRKYPKQLVNAIDAFELSRQIRGNRQRPSQEGRSTSKAIKFPTQLVMSNVF